MPAHLAGWSSLFATTTFEPVLDATGVANSLRMTSSLSRLP
jgi:hypothetical protein